MATDGDFYLAIDSLTVALGATVKARTRRWVDSLERSPRQTTREACRRPFVLSVTTQCVATRALAAYRGLRFAQ